MTQKKLNVEIFTKARDEDVTYSLRDVANMQDCSVDTVKRVIKQGRLVAYNAGAGSSRRRLRVSRLAYCQYVAEESIRQGKIARAEAAEETAA